MKKFPKVKCPYCFRVIKYNNVVFRCNSGEQMVDNYLKTYHLENGNPAFEREDYWVLDPALLDINQVEIDEEEGVIKGVENPEKSMRLPLTTRLCPYCHNELLRSFGRKEARYIAVVGVPNSGKTTFLAAVNASLRGTRRYSYWGSLDANRTAPLDDVTNKYSANDASARVATKAVQGPYFYHLQHQYSSPKGDSIKTDQDIIFFDIPGEFYTSPETISTKLASYLENADGIVFIVNSAEEIEHQEAIKRGETARMVNVTDILDAFHQAGVVKNKKVAIVFNKLDKVKSQLNLDNLDMFVPESTEEFIDNEAILEKSKRISTLMLGEGAGITNPTQNALFSYMKQIELSFGKNCCIFATRLLVEKEGTDEYFFRCDGAETPLLWLLSEMGAFPKKPKEKK